MLNILVLLFLINFNIIAKEKIVIVTNEWKPYVSKEMEDLGLLPNLINEVFKKIDIEVEYKFYPWRRGEEMVRNGKAFGTFPYRVTDSRKNVYDFSESLIYSRGLFFYLKNNFEEGLKWDNYEDLLKYNVSGVMGYWYEEPFSKYKLKVDYSATEEIALRKLYTGRVDILAGDELVMWNLIKEIFPDNIDDFDTSSNPLNDDDLHIIVSKDNFQSKLILEKFNKALKEMKVTGEYEKIMNKK